MELKSISSYLIFPGKNINYPPAVEGSSVPLSGNLFRMLNEIFINSNYECKIPIRFNMAEDGSQKNVARDSIINYIKKPSIAIGTDMATRLRDITTKTPGLCLLFILLGRDERESKLLLSRFPADQGIVAERRSGTLELSFLERVFIKSERRYKASLFQGSSFENDFWNGFAIDKQLNEPNYQIAHYWIKDFLAADYFTTSKAGTKRFAVALRKASMSAKDLTVKQEIAALSLLIKSIDHQVVSIYEILEKYNISNDARKEILKHVQYPELAEDTFIFDADEFLREASYVSIELDTGGILTAPSDSFDELFKRVPIDEDQKKYQFTTDGIIVDERVRAKR